MTILTIDDLPIFNVFTITKSSKLTRCNLHLTPQIWTIFTAFWKGI